MKPLCCEFVRLTIMAALAASLTGCVVKPPQDPDAIERPYKDWVAPEPAHQRPAVNQIPANANPETRALIEGIMTDFEARGGDTSGWEIIVK